ncbi:MAG: type II toxin-antitoxin system death-on-curing family toxin [Phycisphaerae bacterium]|nr:type II toxin-antitoxin system death-on-curing family toxin [Gemmatimonadaceae bacterium]
MTRYLSLAEVLDLYARVVALGGGAFAIRDLGSLESAIAQPRATYDGVDLYPTLAEKAAALGYSLILNHPFVDGNKRIGHAAIEVFLVLNGFELTVDVDAAESIILGVAEGTVERATFVDWIAAHCTPYPS